MQKKPGSIWDGGTFLTMKDSTARGFICLLVSIEKIFTVSGFSVDFLKSVVLFKWNDLFFCIERFALVEGKYYQFIDMESYFISGYEHMDLKKLNKQYLTSF